MEVVRVGLLLLTVAYGYAWELTDSEKSFVEDYNDFQGKNRPDLQMDQAYFTINSSLTFELYVYAQNEECLKCPLMYVDFAVPSQDTKTLIVNTTFGTTMQLRKRITGRDAEERICTFNVKFRERGEYWLFMSREDYVSGSCRHVLTNDPMAAEMPILYTAIGVLVLCIAIKVVAVCYRRRKTGGFDTAGSPADINAFVMGAAGDQTGGQGLTTKKPSQRLHSLDTFRGLSLVIMIFVNFEGGGYWFFGHAPWNGLTLADLVFPWFVFIMGTSMNYSFRGMIKRGKSRFRILWKVVRRSCILFGLGILLNTNWGPVKLETMRIPGVLQRLALSYLVVALMETVFARREDSHQDAAWSWLRDVVLLLPEWFISLSILAVYLCLTFLLPVPGCPTGYIGPGGLHDNKQHEKCTGGAAMYVDKMVLGEQHLYTNPTPKAIYQTVVPFDPEGILGTLTSIFLCFLGLQAGRIFITYKEHKSRVIRLLIWAVLTGAIGAGLCECSQNGGVIPVNKNLWSLSFLLLTASFGYLLLAALYVVIDVLKFWGGDPFIFAGMNPLLIYLAHEIFYRCFPVNWVIDRVHWKMLLKAIWDVAIFMTIAFILHVKKIYVAL